MIQPIDGSSSLAKSPGSSAVNPSDDSFARVVDEALAPQVAADKAVASMVAGANGDLHGAMIAMEKSEISLKYLVNVRNHVVEAYREMMRMGG